MNLHSEFITWLAVTFVMLIAADRTAGNEEEWRLDRKASYRGVAVLSSNIGKQLTIDEVVDFAKTCELNLVVIDYAWITHHWPLTNHAKVGRLVTRLQHDGVKVAAMYRPRAMNPSEASVHWALNMNGAVPEHHNSLCFAHEDSVKWGASWGRKILEKQPEVRRIILYNLRPICTCTECRGGQGWRHGAAFIDQCRRDWRSIRTNIEIGHVGVGTAFVDKVDFVCPFLSVNRDDRGRVDIKREVSLIRAAKSKLKRQPVIPLVKVCWSSNTENTTADVIEAVTRCTRAKFGFILWYYEWLFQSETDRYERKSILKALKGDWNVMTPYYARTDRGKPRRALRNKPWAWVYFESKESHEGCAPSLMLKFGKTTRMIPVSKDVKVLSNLPEMSFPINPCLSIQLSDENRTLLYFDLPRMQEGAELDRAELSLDMKNSNAPVVAPFDLAIHAVTQPWDERTTTWQNQPSFLRDPVSVVSVEPRPGMLRLDVTNLVLAWMNDQLPNNGMLLKVFLPLKYGHLSKKDPLNTGFRLDDIAIVAVKDFMRIENSSVPLKDLRFPRYFPVIDNEQAVLARWVIARTDEGKEVEIKIADITADTEGNLIHTYQIDAFPARTGVLVTVTSLILRRERPAPEGAFPILERQDYPDDVQPFLRSTSMIVVDHHEIKAAAEHLLGKTNDAYEVAADVAAMMKSKSSKQPPGMDGSLPTSVQVLKYGGTCCGSAVTAAALLRACGIPTRITYCPAGFIHGIISFYLTGYGWCRMDATCSVGRLPLVQKNQHRGLVRLFDMPIEMEAIATAYAWPFQRKTPQGPYIFLSEGRAVPTVRFAARDEAEAHKAGRVAGWIHEPYVHLEPGSLNMVLDLCAWDLSDAQWSELVKASHDAVVARESGVLSTVVEALGDRLSKDHLKDLIWRLEEYGTLPD